MENGTLPVGYGPVSAHTFRLRAGSVVVALTLVFTALVLLQHRAEAAPAGAGSVAAAVALPGADGVNAQIGGNFVCSILLSIGTAFSASPFFGFIVAIFNSLLASFNCGVSIGAG